MEQLGFPLMQSPARPMSPKGRSNLLLGTPRSGTNVTPGSTEGRDGVVPMRPPQLLFVYPFPATFIQQDFELLQTFCNVNPLRFTSRSQYPALLKAVLSADVIYCWFALPFAAVAGIEGRAMGRKVIVVAGGWDVERMPEIAYGRLLTRRGLAVARVSLGAPNLVLAFSESSKAAIREVAPKAPVHRAYLGVDADRFRPGEKENLVVTIAQVSRDNVLRKGLKTFVQAAKEVPEAQFVVVGKRVDEAFDELRGDATSNVRFTGELSDAELRGLLSRARVYVQASYTEGFGVAMTEAMAAGCVPVATRRGALPEVVGDTGFYVEYGDPRGLGEAIRKGLHSELGTRARQRVLERFTIGQRLETLRSAVLGMDAELTDSAREHRGD